MTDQTSYDIIARIAKTINDNQETFIAYYLKQNPDTDLSKAKLCYGIRGNYHEFWIEERPQP